MHSLVQLLQHIVVSVDAAISVVAVRDVLVPVAVMREYFDIIILNLFGLF